jgi:hypothetical protein
MDDHERQREERLASFLKRLNERRARDRKLDHERMVRLQTRNRRNVKALKRDIAQFNAWM